VVLSAKEQGARATWAIARPGSTLVGREQGVSKVNLTLADDGVVRIGCHVRVQDADGEDEFALVPEQEADAHANRVSADSPLGRALLGRRVGERVRFRAPGGVMGVTVLAVDGEAP
jgi:transcription elongation GreA/GreB family factor